MAVGHIAFAIQVNFTANSVLDSLSTESLRWTFQILNHSKLLLTFYLFIKIIRLAVHIMRSAVRPTITVQL